MGERREVFIAGSARTPIGNLNGALGSLTAPQLGAVAIKGALQRAGVSPSAVQEVFFGNVLPANIGQAPARQASLAAGIPTSAVCSGVNKVCASGTKAIILGAQSILSGDADIVVVGGMESMTNAPYYLPKVRQGLRMGHSQVVDGVIRDGLWDPYGDVHMGTCAELCAREHSVSRQAQDEYAAESFARAKSALTAGAFDPEIVPVQVTKGKTVTTVAKDETAAKGSTLEGLAKLSPAFQKQNGSVTAGNSSGISDGAAALVLVSGAKARELGLKVIARIVSWGEAAQEPERFTTAPALAIPKALARASLTVDKVDFFEINEAFAVVSVANNKLLGLDPKRVNVFGGAVALGHPIGCSGARIVVTLLNVLQQKGGKIGCAAICNGGGGASALVVERVDGVPPVKQQGALHSRL